MKQLSILVLSAALSFAATGTVQASEKLATDKGCLGCHQINKKLVGPAYEVVAATYSDKNSEQYKKFAALNDKKLTIQDYVARNIKNGGAGKWGPIPMPPQSVTEDESKVLAKWIFSLAPKADAKPAAKK
jgi:cytochrome c